MSTKERSQEEILLRENVRKAIRIVLDRRSSASKQQQLEEQMLRKVIRGMISEAQEEIHPYTWQNDLQGYLRDQAENIIKAYQKLTTNAEQRATFFIVLEAAIQGMFEQLRLDSGVNKLTEVLNNLGEDIDVTIDDDFEEKILPTPEEEEAKTAAQELEDDLGMKLPEKLNSRGLEQAIQVFNNNIRSQVQTIYKGYQTSPEDAAGFESAFWENINVRLKAAEELIRGGDVEKLIDNIKKGEDLPQPELTEPEIPETEIPETEVEETNEVVGLEEYIDIDELLSNI